MRLAVFSAKGFEIDFIKAANSGQHHIEFIPQRLETASVHLASEFDAISIFSADTADANILRSLGKFGVRFIALRSTGYDNVDLDIARELGIGVANVPSYSPHAIAEHAIGLLQAVNRRIVLAQSRVARFNFELDPLMGHDLNGKTAAVLGVGHIGKIIGKIMDGFGCRLLGYDVKPDPECIARGMLFTDLASIAREADLIFVALPLNEQTHYLLEAEWFSKLLKRPILVNVARGKIVHTSDLLNALDEGNIAHYATDVYEHESGVFFYDHSAEGVQDALLGRLIAHPRVLLTPHQAFVTHEAIGEIARTTMENINSWEQGRDPVNLLT